LGAKLLNRQSYMLSPGKCKWAAACTCSCDSDFSYCQITCVFVKSTNCRVWFI